MSAGKWKNYWGRQDHHERGQVSGRKHLGMLEKKKDYKLRADDFHRKKEAIEALRKQAAFRNPDEFYFKMQSTKKSAEGEIEKVEEDLEPTLAETLDLDSKDIRYLEMHKRMEDEKIAELKGHLHMARDITEEELKAKHTAFVDDEHEAATLNEAEFFDTDPEYLTRAFNRPTKAMLESGKLLVNKEVPESKELRKLERERARAYGELSARMQRAKQLEETIERLRLKRNLQVRSDHIAANSLFMILTLLLSLLLSFPYQTDKKYTKIKRGGQVTYKWVGKRKR